METNLRRLENVLPSPRILIVDDNLIHSSAIKRALVEPVTIIGRLKCEVDVVDDLNSARVYLKDDAIDIYFLDLEISEKIGEGPFNPDVGKAFVRDVVRTTNAGIIVCSSLPAEREASGLLEDGADDYVDKNSGLETIAARTLSVWRRVLYSRPNSSKHLKYTQTGRTFVFGDWHFVVGSRLVTSASTSIRISATEHAFLRYLCAVESHEINEEIFNIDVLDRDQYKIRMRLDNFIHRLRKKFDGNIELTSQGGGFYRLLNVRELKATL